MEIEKGADTSPLVMDACGWFVSENHFIQNCSFSRISMRVKLFPSISSTVLGKAPVTSGLRPGYDLPATEKCRNRGQIVERTYNCSQRSWVIARAKSVAARLYIMFKTSHTGLTTRLRRSFDQHNSES